MKKISAVLLIASAMTVVACADSPVSPDRPAASPSFGLSPKASSLMSNYVAIGTSLSMGWFDDGVFFGSQEQSWTKQLADEVRTGFTLPLIAAPGCQPPLISPLLAFRRVDNTSAASSAVCAPLVAGVVPGQQNLAVENATAGEALNATPATASQGRGPVTSRVLPAGMTQITAMRAQNPTFVSVEFGGNEILKAQAGFVAPGLTIVPLAVFQANYAQIIQNVTETGAAALLVTLPTDFKKFPTIRTGPEIGSQRVAFAAFNVTVSADCDASENFIFVRGKVLTAIATGAAMAGAGLGPYTLSCADVPFTVDYVLSPTDIASLNGLAAQMSATIESHAAANGYAHFSLGVLYDRVKEDVPFELGAYLTSPTPYGPKISLDGNHPSARGHRVLARAARVAIQRTYGTGAR